MNKLSLVMLLSFFVSCTDSSLKVQVGTVGARHGQEHKSVGIILNQSIEKLSSKIDRDKGLLKITFNYPSQKWFLPYSDVPVSFMIRLFDKNGQYLTHFETKEKFAPVLYKESAKKNNPEAFHGNFNGMLAKSNDLLIEGNELTYQLNKIVSDSVESVEFGFNIISWFSKNETSGYWFNYPKKLGDDKCFHARDNEVYVVGKNIKKLGEFCTTYVQGSYVIKDGVISVSEFSKCGNEVPASNRCCARTLDLNSGFTLSKGWDEETVYKDEVGDCKCKDPNQYLINGQNVTCGDYTRFIQICMTQEEREYGYFKGYFIDSSLRSMCVEKWNNAGLIKLDDKMVDEAISKSPHKKK